MNVELFVQIFGDAHDDVDTTLSGARKNVNQMTDLGRPKTDAQIWVHYPLPTMRILRHSRGMKIVRGRLQRAETLA